MKEPKNVKERAKKPPYRQGHNPERKCFTIIIRKKDIHKILSKLKDIGQKTLGKDRF